MLFCCPCLLCQAADYAAYRAVMLQPGSSEGCTRLRQPGSAKGCTVAIASMSHRAQHRSQRAGFTRCAPSFLVLALTMRGFRGFRRGAEPPKATQKSNGCERWANDLRARPFVLV